MQSPFGKHLISDLSVDSPNLNSNVYAYFKDKLAHKWNSVVGKLLKYVAIQPLKAMANVSSREE